MVAGAAFPVLSSRRFYIDPFPPRDGQVGGERRRGADDDRRMRFLIGPIVVLCMLCGWDAYSNHGRITRQANGRSL
jgi:hypothetical protein